MSSRSLFWAAAILLAVAGPVAAQRPSPLELVRGIRESGSPDLALEYLKEIEGKLSDADKVVAPLERAKCLLEAAEEEPDEGTRMSLIGEAKEGFNSFLALGANHPRASEASLALARLIAIEAKAQLNRGRRMELPSKDDPGFGEAVKKQQEEMLKARPLFLDASKRFRDAAKQLKDKLNDSATDVATKQILGREVFDADLASAINKYYLADTFLLTGALVTIERDKYLEEARSTFAELAKGPPTSRTVWIARAWMAEVLADQAKPNDAANEFAAILAVPRLEAEEGKRLVRFFQIRRVYLGAIADFTSAKLQTSEGELKSWLAKYGTFSKPTPEAIATKFYLAYDLQLQAQVLMGPPPKDGKPYPPLTQTQRTKFQEAEKLYRTLAQSDNDYTARANRNRMFVVRRLLGEADQPTMSYVNFEAAQMAALIQMAKLGDAEKALNVAKAGEDDDAPFWQRGYQKTNIARINTEVTDRKHRVVALLERARELATDKDSQGDVTDNLLRLVYFYQTTDQPFEAAVLGEHIARTIKTTGGKSALAGLMALNGYKAASARIKAEATDDPAKAEAIGIAVAAARKADRDRAMIVAQFLDKTFPNDTATDSARHQLALMLNEELKYNEAFEIIVKIRPGYSAITGARQLEGYVASMLIGMKEMPADQKRDIFRRAVNDLGRVSRPSAGAPEEDVRGYISCRLRLALLLLSQSRADPEIEKNAATRGFVRSREVSEEVIASIPLFENLLDKKNELKLEGLNLDGRELKLQALDMRTRALYLQGKSLVDGKEFDGAAKTIDPIVEDVKKGMLYDDKMKDWAGAMDDGKPGGERVAEQKIRISKLAAGIDKIRRDIVMVGFKLRCVQGNKDEAAKMLAHLKLAGGGIETNQATFEQMARELAAQMAAFRKEGKTKDADDLGAGLTLLLKEFTTLKELNPATILFLGHTFYTVGQYDEALAQFAKIKVPVVPPAELQLLMLKPDTPWWEVDPTKIMNGQVRKQLQEEIRDYRFAQLDTAKSLHGAGKLAEAEKLLKEAIGDAAKKGYAFSSLDFRKELASVYESTAATITESKPANAEWQKALKEWTTLFQSAQQQVKTGIKPKTATDPGTPPDEAQRIKNNFFDAYFEVQRVLTTANIQLIKDPAKLAASFERIGKSINDLETFNKFADLAAKKEPLITPEVAFRYWELLEKNPGLKKAYKDMGGKFFLDKPNVE